MRDNTVRTEIRLPPELHRQLVILAATERRSLNSMMVVLLMKALEGVK